jgi:hypothetical protein
VISTHLTDQRDDEQVVGNQALLVAVTVDDAS